MTKRAHASAPVTPAAERDLERAIMDGPPASRWMRALDRWHHDGMTPELADRLRDVDPILDAVRAERDHDEVDRLARLGQPAAAHHHPERHHDAAALRTAVLAGVDMAVAAAASPEGDEAICATAGVLQFLPASDRIVACDRFLGTRTPWALDSIGILSAKRAAAAWTVDGTALPRGGAAGLKALRQIMHPPEIDVPAVLARVAGDRNTAKRIAALIPEHALDAPGAVRAVALATVAEDPEPFRALLARRGQDAEPMTPFLACVRHGADGALTAAITGVATPEAWRDAMTTAVRASRRDVQDIVRWTARNLPSVPDDARRLVVSAAVAIGTVDAANHDGDVFSVAALEDIAGVLVAARAAGIASEAGERMVERKMAARAAAGVVDPLAARPHLETIVPGLRERHVAARADHAALLASVADGAIAWHLCRGHSRHDLERAVTEHVHADPAMASKILADAAGHVVGDDPVALAARSIAGTCLHACRTRRDPAVPTIMAAS